jgi:hypothetical protein
LGDKIKNNEMGGACSMHGREERSIEGVWWGKRPLGRPRCRWENNIKIDLQKMGWGGMEWIGFVQDERQVAVL